jgi:5-methylthioadenosine/S-adenosylhomocysteine deaminase
LTGTRYVAEAVLPCDEAGTVLTPGIVDVDAGGRIVWVGGSAEAPDRPDWTVHRRAGMLLPGLVNLHCHSPMTLLRGQGEGLPLARWLSEVIWPREARVDPDDVFWGMTLASGELLRYGVTTTVEMYFHDEAMIAAVEASGARCVLTPGVVVAPGWERFGGWERQVERIAALHAARKGDPLIEVGFGPHSAYALPEPALAAVGELARDLGALIHLHLAETEHEGDAVSARHGGASVPEVLVELGVFTGNRVLGAHAVWLSDADLDLLARHDVAIAHCPGSNAKLASGTARLIPMLRAGLRVGLGTDGPASNDDLDLWEEARLAALLARLEQRDPTAVSAYDALALATRDGAMALGRDDIGVLAPGRWADFVLLDLADPGFVPVLTDRDLVAHTVWSASRRLVRDVWVAGRQVVRDGECLTVDLAEAGNRVQAAAARLAAG